MLLTSLFFDYKTDSNQMFKAINDYFNRPKMFENLSPADFKEAFNQASEAVIIDVRSPEEFTEGHIKGAVNVDIMSPNFPHRVTTLDKSKQYFVVCRSGARSSRACSYLAQQGFDNPVNLAGGMVAWSKERM